MVKIHSKEELSSKERFHMMSIRELEEIFNVDIKIGQNTNRAKEMLDEDSKKEEKPIYMVVLRETIMSFFDYFSIILWVNFLLCIFLYTPFGDHAYTYPNHLISMVTILVCLIIKSILIGYIEYRSIKLLRSLQSKDTILVSVLRDGHWNKIKACELVRGDVVQVNTNESVPFDLRLIYVDNLSFDKSILTGESEPIEAELNHQENVESNMNYYEAKNMAFRNFTVVNGYGRGIVVSVDTHSYFIDTLKNAKKYKKQKNLIKQGINKLAFIIALILISCSIIYLIWWASYLQFNYLDLDFYTVKENFIIMLTCGIPIGLPTIITVGLFIVMKKLRKLDILVKNIYSLFTISAIDVVLTDKTGTLTQNFLDVASVYYSTKEIDVKNCQQSPDVYLGAQEGLNDLLDLCDFCLPDEHTQSAVDSTLFRFARKNRPHFKKLFDEYQVVEEINFSSTSKYHVKLIKSLDQQYTLMVRGAPDFLLPKCKFLVDENGKLIKMDENSLQLIDAKIHHWSSMGRRLICFCKLNLTKNMINRIGLQRLINWFNNECNYLTFIGMIGFINPLKPCIKESVSKIQNMDVRIIVATGDYSITAISLSNQAGILSEIKYDTYTRFRENIMNKKSLRKAIILNGQEVDKLTKNEWKIVCSDYKEIILSRSSPKHKLTCVKEFQSNGHSVLMIGDGVNDVPALQHADLSVSMGSGSKLAQDVSSVILLNNSFSSIVELLIAGRQTFFNIKKCILLSLVSCVFTNSLASFLTINFGMPQLYSNLQMTIVSSFGDILPSISLFFDKLETYDFNRGQEALVDRRLLIMGFLFLGPITNLFSYFIYYIFYEFYTDLDPSEIFFSHFSDDNNTNIILTAKSVGFYSFIVMQVLGNFFSIRTRKIMFFKSLPFRKVSRNVYLIVSTLFIFVAVSLIVSFPIYDFTQSIPLIFYFIPYMSSIYILLINEIRKLCLNRFNFLQTYLSW